MAEPPAQGESANASGGDNTAGRGQAKCMRRVIHISPGTTTLNADRTCHGIDANALHRREIDDQAIIAHAKTTGIVAATTHGNEYVVIAGEMDRSDDVGDIGAPHDQAGMPVNHAIIDLAHRLVAGIVGLQ
jgi:hypothetical protein